MNHKNRFRFARTRLLLLLPFTAMFGALALLFLYELLLGIMKADGGRIMSGAFLFAGTLLVTIITATQLRRAMRDARTAKIQRRS
jgi:hypothetical protein